jgi:hypothetical protein
MNKDQVKGRIREAREDQEAACLSQRKAGAEGGLRKLSARLKPSLRRQERREGGVQERLIHPAISD